MVAIIEPADIRQRDRMKADQPHARIEHQLRQLFLHLVAAGGIDQNAHFDTAARLVRQRVRELVADRALPPDVRLDVHALPGRGDVLEQQRKKLIAVFEQLHRIAALHARLRETDDRWQQHGELADVLHIEMRIGAAFGRPEQDRQADDGENHGDQHDQRHADDVRAAAGFFDPFSFGFQLRLQKSSAMTG